VAWATAIVTDDQVAYRVAGECGCDRDHPAPDEQVDYRLRTDLAWIGAGLGEVGLTAGGRVDPDAARALMAGTHPDTGELLLAPKQAPAPAARVAAAGYVAAVTAMADAAGVEAGQLFGHATARTRWQRLARGVLRDGEAHTVSIGDLERLAMAGPVDLADVYPADVLATARAHRDDKVTIGTRGHDVVLNIPKSISALYAIADPATAAAIEAEYLAAVGETVTALEAWAGYGVTGHQGDGQLATRIESSGFIGWTMLHRSARPTVTGRAGDPHLHAHVVLAHMVRCADGEWRVPASGGRDIYRHVAAAGELVKARVRARLTARLGVGWTQDEHTREWEITGIPEQLRGEFSQRSRAIAAKLAEQGTPDADPTRQRLVARQTAEARPDIEAVDDVRADWQTRAAAVVDVPAVLAATLRPGPDGPTAGGPAPGSGPDPAPWPGRTVAQIAEAVWTGEHALTAHTKAVTRAQVLTAVAAACPGGIEGLAELDALTDAVIAAGPVLPVEAVHASHHSNTARWTTRDIVDAETTVLAAAKAGVGAGLGQVSPERAELVLAGWEERQGLALSGEQRAAVTRLTTGGHGVDAVVGVAGAGKTTLMDAARTVWESAGYRVAGASTAAVAAAGLRAEAGIPSRTIASLLADIGAGRGIGADVLVVDEAAVTDDRHHAVITTAAAEQGCKVVLVGDHLQLRAIGVGGTFHAVHHAVDGPVLTENRRQRDPAERDALATWRAGARRTALTALAGQGRVHATDTADQARAQLAAGYVAATEVIADPHARARAVLLMAPRVDDVDALNALVRAHLQDAGQLAGAVAFRRSIPAGGGSLEFAVGDLVRIRRNDYRSRRSTDPDVLNGYRGVVVDVDQARGVQVEWTRPGDGGGTVTESAWLAPTAIAGGDLSHGYALTVAAAQGQTCERGLLYGGVGADDAHTLYPGLTRARERTDLWIPRTLMEDPETAARHGDPDSPEDQLARAVAALATTLDQSRPDGLITPHLLHQAGQDTHDDHQADKAGHVDQVDQQRDVRQVDDVDQVNEPAHQDGADRQPTDDAQPVDQAADVDQDDEELDEFYGLPEDYATGQRMLRVSFPSPGHEPSPEDPQDSWRRRQGGRLTRSQLAAGLAQARTDVDRARFVLADLAAMDTDPDHTPRPKAEVGAFHAERVARVRRQLAQAATHDQDGHAAAAAAVKARQAADQHRAAADAAADQAADLMRQAGQPWNLLTRRGLTRQGDQARAEAFHQNRARHQAIARADQYAADAARHAEAATRLRGIVAPGESDDQALARVHAEACASAEKDLTRARTRLGKYETETAHRAAQPASTQALEDQARAAARQVAVTASIRGGPGHTPSAPYRPPPPPTRNPGRGR
jgi:conjugative relaxase-like TrwC/TraI family protein